MLESARANGACLQWCMPANGACQDLQDEHAHDEFVLDK